MIFPFYLHRLVSNTYNNSMLYNTISITPNKIAIFVQQKSVVVIV